MSTSQLLNNANIAIAQSKLTEDERNALIQDAVAPLTAEELTAMLRDTAVAAEVAVSYYVKYKKQYEASKIKVGKLAVALNQFIKNYRDERDSNIEMIETILRATPNLDLSNPQAIENAVTEELGTIPEGIAKSVLFEWTLVYFVNLSKEVVINMNKETNAANTATVVPEVTPQVDPQPEPTVEAAANTTAPEPTPEPTPSTTAETTAAPVVTEEEVKEHVPASEKEYVQWTREACAAAHAEGIAKGEDEAKAARRAALMGKLVGGFHENLDKAKENDVKWNTGVAGYEKEQADKEAKHYLDKGIGYVNAEPLFTKVGIHVINPVVNKVFSWL